MSQRINRLQEEIKKEVSHIIQHRVKDPRLGFVSVTGVELSRDYAYCKIYISVLGDESAQEQTMAGLVKATGFIRSELAKKIRFRSVPQLTFHYDSSLEYGSRINAILKELNRDGGNGGE
ncbi:MAG: 30S ribosome-binding factor RbfA [Limnochordia bacterium]|jgi:ribosome-binding factor A|nr:30S ribosome-binding factor RbfA [Bacillota bacterium]HOB07980.1 30S ribosome-binding factor RbfA [Limnochordia bacterium]NLH31586.1 30S ribosome-binding factor RbfA [Bacillota bacterium]HPT92146.1 30S ribosome-binding factor RbfA [Limnochordia bacterium]HPZ29867.1 30S ribosome-binding factor RbfA [Limnochordia bacterium]